MIPFQKSHGAGNDFVLVDARELAFDWSRLARRMCDRHFGVGSDGLLLVEHSQVADYRMRMFNPDGSEAEMCGNGIRCFAKLLFDDGLVLSGDRVTVETLAGIQKLRVFRDGGKVVRVRVGMGAPRFQPDEIPVRGALDGGRGVQRRLAVDGQELDVTCVSMGNPHAVAFIEAPVGEFPLERVGPLVERHADFPARTNFEIVNVLAPDRLRMRVWERGAGLTLACGTGACGVMVAARLHGHVGPRATIELPGGTLEIEWDGEGEVWMTGPAELVFTGEWQLD
jgi:diaminopimelate epimerase